MATSKCASSGHAQHLDWYFERRTNRSLRIVAHAARLLSSCCIKVSLSTLGDQREALHEAHTRNVAPMCGRLAFCTEPAKVARLIQAVTLQSVPWPSPGSENLDELHGLLKPAKKGTLDHDPVSKGVGKVTNDGEYLLELNSE